MNDFDAMRDKIGNRFDLVLVASERLRQLHKQRKEQDETHKYSGNSAAQYLEERKRLEVPTKVAFAEIEAGTVGREYLALVRERRVRNVKPKRGDFMI